MEYFPMATLRGTIRPRIGPDADHNEQHKE
jgi:hypothetical protein